MAMWQPKWFDLLIDQSFCWKAELCGTRLRQASQLASDRNRMMYCRDMNVMFPSRFWCCHGMEPRHFTILLMDCPEASVKVGYDRETLCSGVKWTIAVRAWPALSIRGVVNSRDIPLEVYPFRIRKILSLGRCWKSNSQYEPYGFDCNLCMWA